MKIKNIIIDGKLKFIHIYYKNYKELDILKIKFDGFVYKLYEYKRGNIMSLRMSNVNDECRNYYVLRIKEKEKEKDINKARNIEKDLYNYVIELAKEKGIERKWSNPGFKKMYCDKISNDIYFDTKIDKININILKIDYDWPVEFLEFVKKYNLKPPKKNSKNGKALLAMLNNPYKYWTREECEYYVNKCNINTNDSIQLFNKHEQWGIKTSSERGKNYIIYPYELSNKHKMRKNFIFDGTQEQKNNEINKIKSTIKNDYIDSPNSEWQLGHKNPESEDNSNCNLVLQPPIQGKYRDKYIFIDTLTKIPTPKTFIELYNSKQLLYTNEQLIDLRNFLNSLNITP
jgi:hypothetical protein